MKKILTLIALFGVLICQPVIQTGCSTIGSQPTLTRLAVQYATVKVLENNPGRAQRVIEIATFIEDNAGSSTATSVAILTTLVREQIDWTKLDAADTILVNALIDMVATELTARLGSGPLSPEQALVVKEVASWIKQAATLASTS